MTRKVGALYKLLVPLSMQKARRNNEAPSDANGDALRRMEEAGDNLTRARDVEFSVVFPNENNAKQFADQVCAVGYAASAELTGTVENFPWDVTVVEHMVPSHEEIGAVEDSLRRVADMFGGRGDGWACLSSAPELKTPPEGR